jgi:hypothetical protein
VLRGRRLALAATILTSSLLAACHASGPGDHQAPGIGVVAVGSRRLIVTREPGLVCVESAARTARSCLPADFGFTDSVVSATLGPLDADADLVALLTQPDLAVDGLGPDVARLVVPSESGVDALALWVDTPAIGTREVCAMYTGSAGGTGSVVVHRPAEVGDREVAEAAVADGCG